MSETQPIKPEVKHKPLNKIPLRPTTEGHDLKTPDPELERNEPKYTKEKIKLNLDAKPFKSRILESKNKNQNFNYDPNNNNYHPPPPNYSNAGFNNMNMNNPYYPMQMPLPNYVQGNHIFNNTPIMVPMHPNSQVYAQNQENYAYQQQNNQYYPNNNYSGYYIPNKPRNNNNYTQNLRQEQNKNKTGLDLNSPTFHPRASKNDKTEGLNINAPSYKPRNNTLQEKENRVHPPDEEKKETQETKKKENPLTKLLSGSPKKTTEKSNNSNNKDSEKNTSNIYKKKSSKRNDMDKKFENAKKSEKIKKEEEEKKKKEKEDEEKKRKEEEEREKEEEKKREIERKKREEEERKKKEEEEKVIEKKYFITFKNKKSEKMEKFTFEYIMQFRKWKICTEDELLTEDVKKHFDGFKEELREGGKKKKDRDDNNKKKDNYQKTKVKESSDKKLPVASMEQWARKDLTQEIKAAETYKQKLIEENKHDVLKKDLRDLLNKLTHDNYNTIKKEILDKIKDSVSDQDKFLEVLFQKAVLEKAFVKLYSKMVKELDKELPQKSKRKEKEGEKKKREYSEMRSRLIDKCRTIFQMENNEQFDQYIKEKDPEERRNKLKKFILGNVYFITELMNIKILSKKVGPDCLKNLFDRYQKGQMDKTLKELTLEAIIVFTENFGRIVYEEKTMKSQDKENFKKVLDDIFIKLEKIKDEPGLVGFIKYNIVNLLEKRKNNFALSKFDESQIAKTKEQVEKELENEGKITQENINEKMHKELKDYKESLEEKKEFLWKHTSFLVEKGDYLGKTIGDILEGYFEASAVVIEEDKNPDYIKKFIDELIEYYVNEFKGRDKKDLKERIIKLFENILDISLDVPNIFDIYAYVLNIFLEHNLISFSDLSGLKKEDVSDEKISTTLKYLSEYYKKDDFNEQLKTLPFIENNKELYQWAFE